MAFRLTTRGKRQSILWNFTLFLIALVFPAHGGKVAYACVGARPLAMGGAFIAVADDSSLVYWNPAGLGALAHSEVQWTHTANNRDFYNYDEFVSLVTDKGWGISWIRQGLWGGKWGSDWLVLSYGRAAKPDTYLGVNLRREAYHYLDTGGRGSPAYQEAVRLGLDLGFLYMPGGRYSLGLLVQDANGGAVRWPNGMEERIALNLRPGFAFRPNSRTLIALDVYDLLNENNQLSLRLGGEFKLDPRWRLRAGYYGNDGGALTLGVTYALPDWSLDYAYLGGNPLSGTGGLGGTHQFGIRVRF